MKTKRKISASGFTCPSLPAHKALPKKRRKGVRGERAGESQVDAARAYLEKQLLPAARPGAIAAINTKRQLGKENILSISKGSKVVDGIVTGHTCVVVHVRIKADTKKIAPHTRVPSTVKGFPGVI